MATNYTNLSQVLIDVELYVTVREGGVLTLDLFNTVAQNRWQWFVDNYNDFRERFLENAEGDQDQLSELENLNNEVSVTVAGNKNNPFENAAKFYNFLPFLAQITLEEVGLSPDEIKVRDEEIKRITELTEDDFRNALSFLRKASAISAQELGLGDPQANELLGLSPRKKRRSPTIKDMIRIDNVNKLYKFIEGLIYDLQISQKRPPNLLAIANANQENGSQGDVLDIYLSAVPVPFEISLQHMAKKYLGGANRWFELVSVNNLQPPFVDELGEKLNLLAPGAGSSVIIPADLKTSIAPGARISIGSNRIVEETRAVENVVVNENNTLVVSLSGDRDLSKFKSSEGAFVRVYKPGTTRKNDQILIPLTNEAAAVDSSKPTPTSDSLRRLEKAYINFGIDIKRDNRTRDLVIAPNGNFEKAAGVQAIRQAVLNALKTLLSELPFHPQYGVNTNIGDQFFGTTDEVVIFAEFVRTSILTDPRFESVLVNKLSSTGTGYSMELIVKIIGFDSAIPLAFIV